MLTSRELATVLVALRHWQEQLVQKGPTVAERYPQFDGLEPLSAEEIDALCERLNLGPDENEEDDGRCDCERPGFYSCGVPGVLAHLENRRVAPGALVERCDFCQRIPSDEEALAKLQGLGIA